MKGITQINSLSEYHTPGFIAYMTHSPLSYRQLETKIYERENIFLLMQAFSSILAPELLQKRSYGEVIRWGKGSCREPKSGFAQHLTEKCQLSSMWKV